MTRQMTKPIIVFGTGRSGTTIFHRMLSGHPELAWMSALCNFYPDKPVLNRMLMKFLEYRFVENLIREKIYPVECYAFWDYYAKGFSSSVRDLLATDVTVKARKNLNRVMPRLTTRKRNRLLMKVTGWPRIGYLSEIFRDAKFIHVIRDGRAVANSLMNVDFWQGWQGPEKWRWGSLPDAYQKEWEHYNRSFIVLAGIQWKILMDEAEKAKKQLEESRILEIKYEDLCSDPVSLFKRVAAFSELEWNEHFESGLKKYRVRNTNHKYKEELTPAQQEELESVLKNYLKKYGYA